MNQTLIEGHLPGGLKLAKQAYKLVYLPSSEEYPEDKISIEHRIEPIEDSERFRFLSLRFNSPDQLKVFIEQMVESWAYFKKQRKEINEDNFNFHIQKMQEIVSNGILRVMR